MLGEPVAKLVQLVENMVLPPPLRSKLFAALSISEEDAASIRDVAVYGDWFVIGLQTETPPSPLTVLPPRAVSDFANSVRARISLTPRSERP